MPLRRLWDRLDLGAWLDRRAAEVPGHYRPSLMVEIWTALLHYGGSWMDDLRLRAWLFRLPGRFTRYARRTYLQLRREERLRERLLAALQRITRLRSLPLSTV